MSEKKWWVDFLVPVGPAGSHSLSDTDMDFWHTLNNFVHETFGTDCDSGTGFGMREYNYPRETKEECIFLLARVKKELAKKFGQDLVEATYFEIKQY
ncbi:unnamed protein product [marine sediment metagenome]|uniref:Uncharacterized protein n=1 Tax=marine sediment metagenome TaxID=412755 RepID=X0WH17_9ZZZZ